MVNIGYNPKAHCGNKGTHGKAHNFSSWVSHHVKAKVKGYVRDQRKSLC
jgi:hypothetical protein